VFVLLFCPFHFILFILFFVLFFPNIQIGDLSSVINEKGCVQAGEEWLEKNLLVVAGVAVGIAFLQVRTRKKIPWGHILWGELIF
jgi:hypothetical protein